MVGTGARVRISVFDSALVCLLMGTERQSYACLYSTLSKLYNCWIATIPGSRLVMQCPFRNSYLLSRARQHGPHHSVAQRGLCSSLLTFERHQPASPSEKERFAKDGFLLVENVMSLALVNRLKGRYDKLFRGNFEVILFSELISPN